VCLQLLDWGGEPSTVAISCTTNSAVDAFLVIVIVTSFALFVTTHVAIAAGLLGRKPRLRGLLALVVPPVAPYFGIREGMWIRSIVWVLSLAVYVGARVAASRFR
jgi:hypothetical protein